MWDEYHDESNKVKMYSLQFWLLMLVASFVTGIIAYWLSLHWLSDQTGWSLIWRSMIVVWIITNTAIAGAVGFWLRSVWIRIVSVLETLPDGFKLTERIWRRTLLIEDSTLLPELVPEI